jgi:hypothetical protein
LIDPSEKIYLYEEEGNGYVALSWEPYMEKWILHIECKEWSLSTYKRYRKVGEAIRKVLKRRGINEVYGLSKTPKEVKFNALFGAEYTGELAEINHGTEYQYIVKGVL